MEITININAPELAHAIETLAIAIGCTMDKMNVGEPIKGAVQQKMTKQQYEEKAQAETETENKISNTEYIPTVVEIRAKAQEKGKTPEGKAAIKELLNKYESKSLSTVPEEKRAAFIKDLEAI